jgi:hypothetical protein
VALLALLIALVSERTATAGQHLVRAGESWDELSGSLGPGDEIILMPGRHRDATLENVHGSAQKPVLIRGATPKDPSRIDAERYGLRLINPRHVIIKDLAIDGATIHGIHLDGAASDEEGRSATRSPAPGHVSITNVMVTNTGPRGQRHAIHVQNVDDVRIQSCRIEGWAGSGIEVMGSKNVSISRCELVGKSDHMEVSGIRVRGMSERVRIDRCWIAEPGDQGVCIGGGTKAVDLPELPPTSAPGSLHEATNVQVAGCLIVGGESAVAFVNCVRASVRECTIVDPRQAVVSIRTEQEDPRFGPPGDCNFDRNLITWAADGLSRLTHLGPDATLEGVVLLENLWWAPNWAEVAEKLGPFPGLVQLPQRTNIDPRLDETFEPQNEAARTFGARFH